MMFRINGKTIMMLMMAFGMLLLIGCTPAETEPSVDLGGSEPEEPAVPVDNGSDNLVNSGTDVYIDLLEVMILESFPVQVMVGVEGNLADGCVVLDGITAVREGNDFVLTAASHREGDMCTEALVPFSDNVSLDVYGLTAGEYRVILGEVETMFTLDMDNGLDETDPVDGGEEPIEEVVIEPQQITLFIDSQLVDCVGVGPQKCMVIYPDGSESGEYFYDQIKGFEYEAGYEYHLIVDVYQDPYPPADGSSIRYELVEVISKTAVGPETLTMFIDSQLVDCVGVAPQKCMLVRTDPTAEWEYFYDQIEGFTFEEGREYELIVEAIQVPYPPADGSSVRYVLLEIVSQNLVGAGEDELSIGSPAPVSSRAYIDLLNVTVGGENGREVSVVIQGHLPDGCAVINGVQVDQSGDAFDVMIDVGSEGEVCTMALVPFEEIVPLDVSGLDDGTYTVWVNDSSASFTLGDDA